MRRMIIFEKSLKEAVGWINDSEHPLLKHKIMAELIEEGNKETLFRHDYLDRYIIVSRGKSRLYIKDKNGNQVDVAGIILRSEQGDRLFLFVLNPKLNFMDGVNIWGDIVDENEGLIVVGIEGSVGGHYIPLQVSVVDLMEKSA